MNRLSEFFVNIVNESTVTLEKDAVYDVYPEDSFVEKGYFCTNSAKYEENPEGIRYTAIYLKNKENITIDGNGATILVHGKMTPLLFYGCENITVKNLIIDYAVPTMMEFNVLDNNNGVITIRINDDCLFRVEGNTLYWHSEKGKNGEFYWENACNAPKRYIKIFDPVSETTRDFNRNDLVFEKIEDKGNNVLCCTLVKKDADIRKGDIFQTRNIMRDQVGSMSERCKNLSFINLRVKFMHGLGMVSQFCENVSFSNCDFTPKEGRTIASTADFFQFSGCKGRLVIENCKAFGAQDDFINVHGTHLRIIDVDRVKNSLLLRFMHPESWGFQAFESGDELEFIKWDTLAPYGNSEVLFFEKLNDTDILLSVKDIPADIVPGKDVVENATYTPCLYVRNCSFGPSTGRGILASTRGEVIIENNRFYKTWGPALLIEDDCNFWFESGYTNKIIFRNNVVTACNYSENLEFSPVIQYTPKVMNEEYTGFVHGKLEVLNNTFNEPNSGKHIFHLEYLREAEIRNNIFDAPFDIKTKNCGKIITNNN